MKAATAALAANEQGKFWEFHDMLFENHDRLSDDKIKEIAASLNLNKNRFDEKIKDPQIRNKIQQDLIDGSNADVRGTPTIFINGRLLRNRSLDGFRVLIEKELKKTKNTK